MAEISAVTSRNPILQTRIRAEIVRRLVGWKDAHLPLKLQMAQRPLEGGTYAFTVRPACTRTGLACAAVEHAYAHADDGDASRERQQLQCRVWLNPLPWKADEVGIVYELPTQPSCPDGLNQNSNRSSEQAWPPVWESTWLRHESAAAAPELCHVTYR